MMPRRASMLYLALLAALGQATAATAAQPRQLPAWATYEVAAAGPAAAGALASTASVRLVQERLPEYGASFKELTVTVTPETPSRLRVKVAPTKQQRYEVAPAFVPRPPAQAGLTREQLLYRVAELKPGAPFALTVTRASGGKQAPLFDTSGHGLLFKDQYIELTTRVPPDADLIGLGETTLKTGLVLPRDGSIITLWSRDKSSAYVGANLYSAHPFYLQVNPDGTAHGVLLLNSNAMDVVLQRDTLTYKVIGGLLDLYMFAGPSPSAVLRQYHALVGFAALPPLWALGLQQTRWGYRDISVLEEVVANYTAAGLPLEVVWVDIDYMKNRFRPMEYDEDRYAPSAMRQFVARLRAAGRRWIPLVDAGMAAVPGSLPYDDGVASDIFVKDQTGKRNFLGQVWPGRSVYPSFPSLSPKVDAWTRRQVQRFYGDAEFDGLWLDMNEASNFCSGPVCEPDISNKSAMAWLDMQVPPSGSVREGGLSNMLTTCVLKCQAAPKTDKLSYPPYRIHNFDDTGVSCGQGGPAPSSGTGSEPSHTLGAALGCRAAPLDTGVISPTALHISSTGGSGTGPRAYDVHNLYGLGMTRSFHAAVQAVTGKRPFLLSRSTFPGSGRYTSHWTGDNAANWDNLRWAVTGLLNSNVWGITMAGADICGFLDDAGDDPWKGDPLPAAEYEELCNRWASAGAFYTLSRNHMGLHARDHEFYRWPSVTAAAKAAYGLRYQLLSYIHSSLFLSHTQGGAVAQPLLFTDPADPAARRADGQWMLGEALLVAPVLSKGATSVRAYFTSGTWFSAHDFAPLDAAPSKGRFVTLPAPLGHVPVFLRGGAVVPLQPRGQHAAVTRNVRFAPIELLVTLPAAPSSAGSQSSLPWAWAGPCAAAHAAAGRERLVSCGFLFAEADSELDVSATNTVQVWFVAVTARNGRSGTITSSVVANAGGARGKLRIEAVSILGVPAAASTALKQPGMPSTPARVQQERAVPPAGPAAVVNGQELASGSVRLDARTGVLKLTGLVLEVGQPLQLRWRV